MAVQGRKGECSPSAGLRREKELEKWVFHRFVLQGSEASSCAGFQCLSFPERGGKIQSLFNLRILGAVFHPERQQQVCAQPGRTRLPSSVGAELELLTASLAAQAVPGLLLRNEMLLGFASCGMDLQPSPTEQFLAVGAGDVVQ